MFSYSCRVRTESRIAFQNHIGNSSMQSVAMLVTRSWLPRHLVLFLEILKMSGQQDSTTSLSRVTGHKMNENVCNTWLNLLLNATIILASSTIVVSSLKSMESRLLKRVKENLLVHGVHYNVSTMQSSIASKRLSYVVEKVSQSIWTDSRVYRDISTVRIHG
ncbi:MAG: Uncharacterised protein [Candidatus Poseidoniaceae archaeon]|nr:MAG: Uncharacterised protein [Candidatus Poseidoniaceae archaeon]